MARCKTCFNCSRCGCDHDGLSVFHKAQRKRGQREYKVKRASKSRNISENESSTQKENSSYGDDLTSSFANLSKENNTLHNLEASLGFSKGQLTHNLPSKAVRTNINNLNEKSWSRLTQAAFKACDKAVEIICQNIFPSKPERLMDSVLTRILRRKGFRSSVGEEKDFEKVVESLIKTKLNAKENSIEYRSARAFLSIIGSLKLKVLGERSLACGGNSYFSARDDLRKLLTGVSILPKKKTIVRYDHHIVDQALNYVLSPLCVGVLSWGTKTITLDRRKNEFPGLCRKRSPTRIYESYRKWCSDNNYSQMKRTRFLELVGAVTAGEARLVRAVDYVTGFLVNDNLDLLKRIVEWLDFNGFCTSSKSQELVQRLDVSRSFLKYTFNSHITQESETPSHSISHALDLEYDFWRITDEISDCCGCKFPFYIIDEISKLCEGKKDLLDVLEHCKEKVFLFMGHRVRTVNQQRAIESIISNMRQNCEDQGFSDECHIVIDFKMKFDALYYRKKTVDHYGKRGISWHGALLHYFTYDDEYGEAVGQRAYFDDISFSDNRQDSQAVVSILESLLVRIKEKFPQFKRITIQSDNAKCYMSMDLILAIPLLSMQHNVKITRFIHTETQDGKSLLDAHFATCTKWVREYLKEGHNAVTAAQLFAALMSHGGLPNTLAKLICHDRTKLQRLFSFLQELSNQIGSAKKRANDIFFIYPKFEIFKTVRF